MWRWQEQAADCIGCSRNRRRSSSRRRRRWSRRRMRRRSWSRRRRSCCRPAASEELQPCTLQLYSRLQNNFYSRPTRNNNRCPHLQKKLLAIWLKVEKFTMKFSFTNFKKNLTSSISLLLSPFISTPSWPLITDMEFVKCFTPARFQKKSILPKKRA